MDNKKAYCIFSVNNPNNLLTLLLSIEVNDTNATCIIKSNQKSIDFIEKFPRKINLNIKFIPQDENVLMNHSLLYLKEFLTFVKDCVLSSGEIIVLGDNFLMTEKLEISEEIKKQEFAYVFKDITYSHLDESDSKKYSFKLLYCSNVLYINKIIEEYETLLDEPNIFNRVQEIIEKNIIDISNNDISGNDISGNEIIIKDTNYYKENFLKVGKILKEKLELNHFFDNSNYLSIIDFFAYSNELKAKDITSNFSLKDKKINFFEISTTNFNSNEHITKFINVIIKHVIKKNLIFIVLFNLRFSSQKLKFTVPRKKGICIWDRTKEDSSFYELIETICEKYNDYFSFDEKNVDYFSFDTKLLFDKSSYIYLNNSIYGHTKFYICNYDKSLLSKLDEIPRETKFLFYVTYYPKQLEEILEQRDIVRNLTEKTEDVVEVDCFQNTFSLKHLNKEANDTEENLEFSDFIHTLLKSKYAVIKKFDVKMVATCLALGVVPIFDQDDLYELDEGVHYIKHVNDIDETKYAELKENGVTYYESSVRPEKAIERLLEDIFVR